MKVTNEREALPLRRVSVVVDAGKGDYLDLLKRNAPVILRKDGNVPFAGRKNVPRPRTGNIQCPKTELFYFYTTFEKTTVSN